LKLAKLIPTGADCPLETTRPSSAFVPRIAFRTWHRAAGRTLVLIDILPVIPSRHLARSLARSEAAGEWSCSARRDCDRWALVQVDRSPARDDQDL